MYLAMYALDQDVLTPEFIRTYEHVTFNGWEYLQTEKASTMKVPDPELRKHTVIPVEVRKHVLGTDAEFYGLNPIEFTMYWGVRRFDGTRSLESISGPDQLCFPDEPGLAALRQHWYIYRRRRVHIPAPHRTHIPKVGKDDKETRGRRYSVYLRPWTLLPQLCSEEVPYLGSLGHSGPNRRFHGKQSVTPTAYWTNWCHYLQNVVSEHQLRIIQQFVSITATSDGEVEACNAPDEAPKNQSPSAPEWDLDTVQKVLHMLKKKETQTKGGNNVMGKSLQVSAELWNPDKMPWPETVLSQGHKIEPVRAKAAEPRRADCAQEIGPKLYEGYTEVDAIAWFERLRSDKVRPNTKQEAFLATVAKRVAQEAAEDHQDMPQGKFRLVVSFFKPF